VRIAVIGAGAVGGVLAALAARAGHDVIVTARGDHAAAIARDGLALTGAWGASHARIPVVERIEPPVDLLILATKVHDSASALIAAASCDRTPVLVVQNGFGGADAVRDALPNSPVAIGLALFAASLTAPGHVEVTAAAPLVIGGDAVAVDRALPLLREWMPADVSTVDDLHGAQWTKLLINQVNALPAITGLSVQDVIAHDGLRRILTRGMVETALVGRALGVRWAQLGSIGAAEVEQLLTSDLARAELVPRLLADRMGSVPNPASTLQSIRRGRVTEIDALNGAVADAAAGLRIAAPVNAAMVALVHEVEQTGRFLSPDAVVLRVPAENDPRRTD
jgi:2-dehydropantoate 2-reductase